MGNNTIIAKVALKPIVIAVSLALSGGVQSANIVVGGGCDLVDAITAANSNAVTGGCIAGDDSGGFDTVTLPASTTFTLNVAAHMVDSGDGMGTLEPDSALPLVTSHITVQGAGSTIQRGSVVDEFRLFHVASSGSLSLINLTLSNGHANGSRSTTKPGGAIVNYGGSVRLLDVTLSNNTSNRRGGGIHSRGPLEIDNSVFMNNYAGNEGGGIGVGFAGSLNLQNSQLSNNSSGGAGGGLSSYAAAGNTVYNTTITGNSASGSFATGGGASISNSDLTITNSSVSNNSATVDRAGGMQVFQGNGVTLNTLVSTNTDFSNNGGSGGLLSQANTNIYGGSFDGNAGTGLELTRAGIVRDISANNNVGQYGIFIRGDNVELSNVVVTGNSGAGAAVLSTSMASVTLTSSSFNMNAGVGLSVSNAVLTDLTVSGNQEGGLVGEKLVLNNVTVSNNSATNQFRAGGIRGSELSIYNSSITGNVNTASRGGGIYLSGTEPNLIKDSYIAYNTASAGGGVALVQTSITVQNSRFVSNFSDGGRGGAVYVRGSDVIINESTLASNQAGQHGAGIYIQSGSLSLTASALTGNSSTGNGGGILNQSATVNISNSTFFSNRASGYGGAISAASGAHVTDVKNSTFNANSATMGGGLHANGFTPMLTVSGSVLAGSIGGDCYNQPLDGSNNWFEDASCNGVSLGSPTLSGVMTNLSDEVFFAPLVSSGLVDAGKECGLEVDQNNQPRSVCKCDIGAIEIAEPNPDNGSCMGSFWVVPTANGKTVIFDL